MSRASGSIPNGSRRKAWLPAIAAREAWLTGACKAEMVIRTAGEMRVSNFLLWQSAYSEYYATPTLWPDFGREDLLAALESFQKRKRRFGGLSAS